MKRMIKKGFKYYKETGFKAFLFRTYNHILFKFKSKVLSKFIKEKEIKYYNKYEEKYLKFKNKKNIFLFASIPYYDIGGGQRSSQLAKVFNLMGYNIYYYYAFESSESIRHNIAMPVTSHKNLDEIKEAELLKLLKKDDIFIFEAPTSKFDKYIEIAKNNMCKIVYENIDNWNTSLGSSFFSENTLKLLLQNSDMLIATAKLLKEQLESNLKEYNIEKEVYYLANAVDTDLFEPKKKYFKPKDLVIGRKTLLYYGSLWGEWFDWELLYNLAIKNKDYAINLIGDEKCIEKIVNKMPENIHFLGLKKQVDLPAYLAYSDFAILPFKSDEIGKYVSPLKIFEYISMNKPVLSTCLPDIVNYPNMFCSDNWEKWNEFAENEINIDYDLNKKFIEENNWYNRCSTIIDVLDKDKSEKCHEKFYGKISVVVLNHNNKIHITHCIDTLTRNNERYNYDIIIVDNQSTDGSYELLEKEYSNIKLFKNTKNGCSSGRNLGAENSDKDYIIFLDSDQWVLNKYWLDNYIDILLCDNNIGAIGWSAGWFNKKGFAYHVVDSYLFRYMPPMVIARNDIGYLGTGGFIISRELFNKLDGFDVYYDPTCYEDTDLSLKVRSCGKEIFYCPYLGVAHLPHQTTNSGSKYHENLIRQKGEYFVDKWTKINKKLLKYCK